MNMATHSEKPSGGDLGADTVADEAGFPSKYTNLASRLFERTPIGRRERRFRAHETATWRSFGRQNLDNFGTNMFDTRVDIEALPGQTMLAADSPTKSRAHRRVP
jgi:hypothetical protein